MLFGVMGRRAEVPVGPDVWALCRELIPASSVFGFLAVVLFVSAVAHPHPGGINEG